jgi:hypothetical protein
VTAIDTQTRRQESSRQVVGWRFEELRRIGYRQADAMELALRAEIELHAAVDLVRRGCPHELAVRILT